MVDGLKNQNTLEMNGTQWGEKPEKEQKMKAACQFVPFIEGRERDGNRDIQRDRQTGRHIEKIT